MNGLNNFDKTDIEYTIATSDDLVRFWRLRFKDQGHTFVYVRGCAGSYVNAGESKSISR